MCGPRWCASPRWDGVSHRFRRRNGRFAAAGAYPDPIGFAVASIFSVFLPHLKSARSRNRQAWRIVIAKGPIWHFGDASGELLGGAAEVGQHLTE